MSNLIRRRSTGFTVVLFACLCCTAPTRAQVRAADRDHPEGLLTAIENAWVARDSMGALRSMQSRCKGQIDIDRGWIEVQTTSSNLIKLTDLSSDFAWIFTLDPLLDPQPERASNAGSPEPGGPWSKLWQQLTDEQISKGLASAAKSLANYDAKLVPAIEGPQRSPLADGRDRWWKITMPIAHVSLLSAEAGLGLWTPQCLGPIGAPLRGSDLAVWLDGDRSDDPEPNPFEPLMGSLQPVDVLAPTAGEPLLGGLFGAWLDCIDSATSQLAPIYPAACSQLDARGGRILERLYDSGVLLAPQPGRIYVDQAISPVAGCDAAVFFTPDQVHLWAGPEHAGDPSYYLDPPTIAVEALDTVNEVPVVHHQDHIAAVITGRLEIVLTGEIFRCPRAGEVIDAGRVEGWQQIMQTVSMDLYSFRQPIAPSVTASRIEALAHIGALARTPFIVQQIDPNIAPYVDSTLEFALASALPDNDIERLLRTAQLEYSDDFGPFLHHFGWETEGSVVPRHGRPMLIDLSASAQSAPYPGAVGADYSYDGLVLVYRFMDDEFLVGGPGLAARGSYIDHARDAALARSVVNRTWDAVGGGPGWSSHQDSLADSLLVGFLRLFNEEEVDPIEEIALADEIVGDLENARISADHPFLLTENARWIPIPNLATLPISTPLPPLTPLVSVRACAWLTSFRPGADSVPDMYFERYPHIARWVDDPLAEAGVNTIELRTRAEFYVPNIKMGLHIVMTADEEGTTYIIDEDGVPIGERTVACPERPEFNDPGSYYYVNLDAEVEIDVRLSGLEYGFMAPLRVTHSWMEGGDEEREQSLAWSIRNATSQSWLNVATGVQIEELLRDRMPNVGPEDRPFVPARNRLGEYVPLPYVFDYTDAWWADLLDMRAAVMTLEHDESGNGGPCDRINGWVEVEDPGNRPEEEVARATFCELVALGWTDAMSERLGRIFIALLTGNLRQFDPQRPGRSTDNFLFAKWRRMASADYPRFPDLRDDVEDETDDNDVLSPEVIRELDCDPILGAVQVRPLATNLPEPYDDTSQKCAAAFQQFVPGFHVRDRTDFQLLLLQSLLEILHERHPPSLTSLTEPPWTALKLVRTGDSPPYAGSVFFVDEPVISAFKPASRRDVFWRPQ